jgi:dTDP-4-dehydrorhamnose reductase
LRIFITGASGFIGRACLRAFAGHEVRGTYREHPRDGLLHLDLLDTRAVDDRLDDLRPEAIVHCAARPNVDWCEENPEAARTSNCETTLNLVRAARRIRARVVFLSTDYVFDGEAGPYRETDATRPLNIYGRLKLEMESAVAEADAASLVIRTTNVYGYDPESRNFLMAILPRMARGETVRVAEDQYGTPTLVSDLCLLIRSLLEAGATGVFHVAGPDYVSRYDWARAAAAAFDLNPLKVIGSRTGELHQAARRPLKAGLLSDRIRSLGILAPRGLAEGLERMHADWRSSPVFAW